jgi:hypothetical protein
MKYHFIDLIPDIKAIVGRNGWIWIYYSTIKLGNEYFTDDQTKINALHKHETLNEYASINIILFKNIIKSLENNKIQIDQTTITKYYESYIQTIEELKSKDLSTSKMSELEYLKSKIVISKSIEINIIKSLKQILTLNNKTKNLIDLGKEIRDLNKMIVDNHVDDNEGEDEDINEDDS